MEAYSKQTVSELRGKLKKLGYRNVTSMPKEELVNSAFVADMEHKLVKKYKPSVIDYSKYAMSRCNAYRKQRFVAEVDKKALQLVLFSGLAPEIDFTMDDIDDYLWVSVYIKKDVIYMHLFARLKSNTYVYVKVSIDDNRINLMLSKDKDHAKIVNNVMGIEDYYWYRHTTELQRQLNMPRKTEERFSMNFEKYVDELTYVMFKIHQDRNIKIMDIDNDGCEFDYLQKVNKLFWVHLNLNSFEKNYILYMSSDGVYTLFKFNYEIKMVNDIPVGKILMGKVYLSKNYDELIQKGLIHAEYEMYLNETS
jgi:hypothetical protein